MTLCPPSTRHIRLQVVQRSLSGGFLTEDAALLNANARSIMSDEAIATTPGVRPPLTRAPWRSARGSNAATRGARPQKSGRSPTDTLHVYCSLRSAQVLVVAAAGNSAADPCASYYDPITTPDKLLVGSTTEAGELSSFSNYGACVHVQVPQPPPAPHV